MSVHKYMRTRGKSSIKATSRSCLVAHLVNSAVSTFSKFLVKVVPVDHIVKLGTRQAVLTFIARGRFMNGLFIGAAVTMTVVIVHDALHNFVDERSRAVWLSARRRWTHVRESSTALHRIA